MAMTHLTTPTRWFRRSSSVPVARDSNLSDHNDPFTRMHEEMNRLLDGFFGDAGWTLGQSPVNGTRPAMLQPQLDIMESDHAYELSVELTGVERDDIDLSVDDDVLIIRARKERSSADVKDDQYSRVERSFGRYERMLTLPSDADGEKIGAELKNGVLEVTIPRRDDLESTRGRRIEIKGS